MIMSLLAVPVVLVVTGLSKPARLVDAYARRPQVQERLTSQIDEFERTLEPRGCWS